MEIGERGTLARRVRQARNLPLPEPSRRVLELLLLLLASAALIYLFLQKSPYHAMGAVVVLFAVLFLMRNPVMLTYVLIFWLPVYWINLLGSSLRVITVLTLVALVYHLGRPLLRRVKPNYNRVYVAYALLLLSCAFSLFNSVDLHESYLDIKYFILGLGVFYILTVSIKSPRQLWVVLWLLIGLGVLESILGALQTFVSVKFFPAYYFQTFGLPIVDAYSIGGVRRASGTFEIGPRYAMFLMAPLAIVLAGFFSGRLISRRAWLLLLVPFVFGVFASLTRIAIVLSFFYVVLFNYFERRRQALIATLAGMAVIVVVVATTVAFIVPSDIKNALQHRFSGSQEEDIYIDRFYFLWNALGAFTENPFLGIGVGTYEMRSYEFMQKYPVPWRQVQWSAAQQGNLPELVPVHNEYGRMLAEQGIFSIPIMIFLLLSAFRNLRWAGAHTKDPLIKTMATGMSMYLASMVVYWYFHQYFFEEPYISILPFALSIILYNLVITERAEQTDATPA